jgi:hypothetical protein
MNRRDHEGVFDDPVIAGNLGYGPRGYRLGRSQTSSSGHWAEMMGLVDMVA